VGPGVPLCAVPPVRVLISTETQGQIPETDREREKQYVDCIHLSHNGDTSTSAGFYENSD